jgi:hypothetical protein
MVFAERYAGANPSFAGQDDARRRFGSPDENGRSIARAIAGNPSAFAERLVHSAKKLPALAANAYGGKVTVLWVGLAVLGVAGLIGRKDWSGVVPLLLWPAHLIVYFVTFFRTGYLLLPCLALVALAAVGAKNLVLPMLNKGSVRCLVIGALLIFFIVPVAKHASQFRVRQLSGSPAEEAAFFLSHHFREYTVVGSYMPVVPYFAKLSHATLHHLDRMDVRNGTDLQAFIRQGNIRAIYVDDIVRRFEPQLTSIIEAEIGISLEVIFVSTDRTTTVVAPVPAE